MDFTYPSYGKFKKTLGYFDSIIELNEVAIREFSSKGNTSGNFEDFLRQKSNFHNIRVDFPEIPQYFNSIISRSYIVLVSTCFEEFLEELRNEHQKIKGAKWSWEESVPKLETTFKKISLAVKKEDDINYRICDYYRLVRNSTVHNSEKKIQKLKSEYMKISLIQGIKKFYSSLNAPNQFENITFDDFILYSRAAKTVAFQLCDSIIPTDKEILNLIDVDKFSQYSNKLTRKRNAIIADLRSHYGIPEKRSEIILNQIDKL